MSDFDVSVLPPFTPGMVIVLRGVDFGDEVEANEAIWGHYNAVAKAQGIQPGTPAAGVLPLIIHLADPESSIETVSVEEMAAAGWVREDSA
jgi:hypothetical protein